MHFPEGQNKDAMPLQDQDVIREFLIESHENLARLDQEFVELEKHPKDAALLSSIFRTIHTIKGCCGFLGYSKLEKITHEGESILSELRDGRRDFTPSLASLILETVDAIRNILSCVEATGDEGADSFEELTERLKAVARQGQTTAPAVPETYAHPAETPPPVLAAPSPTPPPTAAKPEQEPTKSSAVADSNIRVGIDLLDKLMDLVGELVLTRNQILQFNTDREDPELNATSQRLNLITSELQEGVMKTRMQPIGTVWSKLPRVVRDISVSLGKQIRLEMDGTETELDRTIIEAIKDPLVHLVRNACDHGIERPEVRQQAGKKAEGKLTLRAYHEGGQVILEIRDDGGGIDVEAVRRKATDKGLLGATDRLTDREVMNLIFHPGFSTAETITNVSGRGVGMDVVKSNIEKIGGVVDVSSRQGEGTTVKLRIPLTLAIIPGLVISSGGERFVIPQVSLLELIRLEGDAAKKQLENIRGALVYRRRGRLLALANLNQILGLQTPGFNLDTTQASSSVATQNDAITIVVLQAEGQQFGLVVDGINDTQEIVVKPLSKQLKGLSGYAGATIMGDGRVALILDVAGIGELSGVLSEAAEHAAVAKKPEDEAEKQRMLLFGAGSFERLVVLLSLVSRLEEFPLSSIESAGGCPVVQYRDQILPLVTVREILEPDKHVPGKHTGPPPADPVQVVVFSDNDRSVGLIVDQILDIAEEAITIRQTSQRSGLLGSGVIGSQVADFLDVSYILRASAANWFQAPPKGGVRERVLVADGSAFSRGLLRGGLDIAGYRVSEAGNLAEATRALEAHRVDIVVTAASLPPHGGSALRTAMRGNPEWKNIPILALGDSETEVQALIAGRLFEACQAKFDREAMLRSLIQLSAAIGLAANEPACMEPAITQACTGKEA